MLEHWQEAFLGALRRTGVVETSAQLAGVSKTQVYYHRQRNDEFKKAMRRAEHFFAEQRTNRTMKRTTRLLETEW